MALALLCDALVLADVLTDIRYSARSLARTPVWTLTLVLTIALGVGSTASVQGFVRGLITTDLPIMGIETVITVFAVDREGQSGPVSFATFTALEDRRDLFQSLGAIRESQERVSIGSRSSLRSVASYTPAIGVVLPFPSRDGVALSHRLRFAQFDTNKDPAGTSLRVGQQDALIAGWMPYWLEGLFRGRAVDLWMPLAAGAATDDRGRFWLLGRLATGVTVERARAVLSGLNEVESVSLVSYTGQTPEAAAGMLRVGAVLRMASRVVFLIACANVAAFLLARAAARARETAVRVAIGARRRQLIRLLIIDSVLISVMGGLAGLILASWMTDLVPLLFFDQVAERLVFTPDTSGILLASMVCIVMTVACGLAPLAATRDDQPSAVLQREIAGPSKWLGRVNAGLILLQMGACTLLVIASGLLLQGFRAALDTSAGRRLGNPIVVSLEALESATRNQTAAAGSRYFDASIAAARSAATVSEIVWAARLPGLRPAWQWARFEPPVAERRELPVDVVPMTPAELERVALPPVSGRLFGAFDAGSCGAVVIDEAMAKTFFSGAPIGRVIDTTAGRSLEVIGVVRPKQPANRVNSLNSLNPLNPLIFEHPDATVRVSGEGAATIRVAPAVELESGLIDVNIVSQNYFDAMGLSLSAGELFAADRSGCRIGVVNEEAAVRWFGGRAIGGAVIDGAGRRTEIVGVVRSAQLRAAQRPSEPTLFLPMAQDFLPRMTAVLATPDTSEATLRTMRTRIAEVPGGRADRLVVTTLDGHMSKTALAAERIAAVLVGTFAVLALTLGALGLYGVLSDSARRRRREFAVRLALGAQGWRVIRQLMIEGMQLAGAGAIAGMAAALLVARWLQTITPGAGVPSVEIWLAAPLLLVLAVAIASVIPARRALSVDLLSLMRDM